jgi:hypothetical protein
MYMRDRYLEMKSCIVERVGGGEYKVVDDELS